MIMEKEVINIESDIIFSDEAGWIITTKNRLGGAIISDFDLMGFNEIYSPVF